MEWLFTFGGQKYQASFLQGVFSTDSPLLHRVVNNMIANKRQVKNGYMGSAITSSLVDDDKAWATISTAIRVISDDPSNTFPVSSVGLEPDPGLSN